MLKAPKKGFRPKPPTPPPQSQVYQTFEAHQSFELAHSSIDHRVADDLARAVRVLWLGGDAREPAPAPRRARARHVGPPLHAAAARLIEAHQSFELAHSSIDHRVADDLARAVRVLCWVPAPAPRRARARHVGRRCTLLLFIALRTVNSWLPAIKLNVTDGPDYLWGKTREAFMYVYKHHYNDADWFLKAEDDTYNSSEPLYFGQRMRQPDTPQVTNIYRFIGLHECGAGYVLSKKALQKFALEAYPSPDLCNQQPLGLETWKWASLLDRYCLSNVGVRAMDSRDSYGRGRLLHIPRDREHVPNTTYGVTSSPYWKHTYYKAKEGINCCSDFAISFHKVDAKWLYILEYFLYHLRPYGINYIHDPSIATTTTNDI
ncbi:unnamed protein product [Plutella xylostella]|uniref:(diamondback moth) hypothetical protein n=1 Tax=Plutella xylostella TaxID=51655 RepID=A0A8S4DNE7_PLUXY|nr:unnamed protein product [Plutella xylostella]